MAKLRKQTSNVEKEKVKVENGKITKSKLSTEVPKMRKPREKLYSPSRGHQSNFENFSSATPFMRNSNRKFTSTPMNVEDTTNSNGRALRSKFVSRLSLSPILKNISNTKQRRCEGNFPEKNGESGKDNDNNVNPDIQNITGERQVISQRNASLSNNSAIMGDTDSSSSRLRVGLFKMDNSSSVTSGSWSDSFERQSTKNLKKDAAVNKNPDHGKIQNEPHKGNIARPRKSSCAENPGKVAPKEKTQYSSSRLRAQFNRTKSSSESNKSESDSSEQRSTKTLKKHVAVNKNSNHGSDNTQSNHDKNHYLLKRLRSDWSSTIFDEETTNVGENSHNTSKRTKKNDDTKFVSRLTLSPISKNISPKNSKEKNGESGKENNLESNMKGSTHKRPIRKPEKSCTESSGKIQSTIHKRAISRPRRTSCIENSEKLAPNEGRMTENSSNKRCAQLKSSESSSESCSSESDSDPEWSSTKKLKKHAVVNKNPKRGSSSSSADTSSRHRQDSDNSKNNYLLKRLRSDWSSTTFGEETTNVDQRSRTTSKRTEKNDVSQQVRENNCSKLRVNSRRSTFDTKSAPEIKTNVNSKLRRKSCYDNSLSSYLKSNGTHTTSGDSSSTQNRTPNNNQIQRKQTNKRKLTPLVEMSLEDIDISSSSIRKLSDTPKVGTRSRSNDNGNEEGYSSSAEFQSDDETNNRSHSKRAPTWKDLLNKSGESPAERQKISPVVRLKRSPLQGSKIAKDLANNEVTKSQHKETVANPEEKESATEVPLSHIMKTNAGPSKEKEKDDVAVETFKQIHDNKEQNQDSVQEVSVCEESVAASSPQHNLLGETNFGKNTSSSLLQNKNDNGNDTEKYETIDLRCPVKFFHSRSENSVSQAKTQQSLKQTRSSKRRKKQESVYEFLSQSSSESNNPVDDVIQKMIKSGKAVVAKHKKGTGMNVVPRKKAKPRVQKKKPTTTEEIKQKPPKPTPEKSPVREQQQEKHQQQDNFDHGLQFDDDFHFDDGENDILEEEQVRDQRGFSNLARSAMIKQAGRIQKPLQRKSITDKKKLLAMAMQFVSQSTPIRMTPQPMSAPQFSPLPGNKSPWRVDDDKLPNYFYLGRDSNNLPSFSSDYIPMTPSKNKSKSLSSFSSNDSNGENAAPPGTNVITNEANMQALTNTRKALTYRSPLKPINIIDIVNLPPLALHSYGNKSIYKNASNNNSKSNEANQISINNMISKETNHSSINKTARNILGDISTHNLNNNSKNSSNQSKNSSNQSKNNSNKSLHQSKNSSNNNSHRSSNHSKIDDVFDENTVHQYQNLSNSINNIQKNNATDLFGFEELIDDSESNSKNVPVDKTILPNKNVLKERLERLKQLRPNTPVVIPNKTERIKPVFDNVAPQQRTLKQMLCSTMIDKNQNNRENHSFNDTGDLSNLFKDLEPETTFDESLPRRTYNRQFKRKRKAVSNYATFIDSDASEDEEEVEKQPIKNYKARPNKRKKTDTEMKKFVNEFNEMCKEVSQYELIVE